MRGPPGGESAGAQEYRTVALAALAEIKHRELVRHVTQAIYMHADDDKSAALALRTALLECLPLELPM